MRSGLIAQKLGMTRIFAEDGSHVPVTVLELQNCQVVGQRTAEKDGYVALQLGAGQAKVISATPATARSRPTISSKASWWTSPVLRSVRVLPVV